MFGHEIHAAHRAESLRRAAEHHRRVRAASRPQPAGALRIALGQRLVRLGERLSGAPPGHAHVVRRT